MLQVYILLDIVRCDGNNMNAPGSLLVSMSVRMLREETHDRVVWIGNAAGSTATSWSGAEGVIKVGSVHLEDCD